MNKHTAVGIGLVLCSLFVLAQTATEGPYTKEQAEAGQALYQEHCAVCHGAKLEGAGGPALDAATLYTDWGTGDALYDMFSKAMPPQSPGTLKPEEYVNILAYILKFNSFPAGSKPLTNKAEDLKQIKFEKPK